VGLSLNYLTKLYPHRRLTVHQIAHLNEQVLFAKHLGEVLMDRPNQKYLRSSELLFQKFLLAQLFDWHRYVAVLLGGQQLLQKAEYLNVRLQELQGGN
jgi:hypothetical protein